MLDPLWYVKIHGSMLLSSGNISHGKGDKASVGITVIGDLIRAMSEGEIRDALC